MPGEEDVQYDNAAFGYFMLTGLFLYIIPAGIYTVVRFYKTLTASPITENETRSKAEAERLLRLQKESRSVKAMMTRGFVIHLVVLGAAIALACALASSLSTAELATYDPFEVLGVESGATNRQIKSAYRKLSLLYHPDKNPGDREAQEKFMQIAKAYETLTDEAARENWEKYGNPDGQQAMQVSIGLPSFLLDKDKGHMVILVYLLFFVAIAVSVYFYKRSTEKYGNKLMLLTEQKLFPAVLKGGRVAKYPEDMYAVCAEFMGGGMPRRPGFTSYADIEKQLIRAGCPIREPRKKSDKPGTPDKPVSALPEQFFADSPNGYMLSRAVLLSHLHRLDGTVAPDVEYMMGLLDEIMQYMMGLCGMNKFRDSLADTRILPAIKIVEFHQNCVQALPSSNEAMMQLPHWDNAAMKFGDGRGKRLKLSFRQFIGLERDRQLRILSDLEPAQQEEVLAVCNAMPRAEVKVAVGLRQGKKEVIDVDAPIRAGKDVVTVGVTLCRTYGDDSITEPPIVHAPRFPLVQRENWWLIILVKPKNVNLKKVKAKITESMLRTLHVARITKQELTVNAMNVKFMAPPFPGDYEVEVRAKCDSYSGLDVETSARFTLVKPQPVRPPPTSGHGHSHSGPAGHGHSHGTAPAYDSDDDEGGLLSAMRAADGAPSSGPSSGSTLTERQQRKRDKRMAEKAEKARLRAAKLAAERRAKREAEADAAGDDAAAEGGAGEGAPGVDPEDDDGESEDDEWGDMVALAQAAATDSEEEEEYYDDPSQYDQGGLFTGDDDDDGLDGDDGDDGDDE